MKNTNTLELMSTLGTGKATFDVVGNCKMFIQTMI